jgi:hypothetical protein
MSFLGSIGDFFSDPVGTVGGLLNKAVSNPLRAALAVTTLGGSEVIRQIPVVNQVYDKATHAVASVVTGGAIDQLTALGQRFTGLQPNQDPLASYTRGGLPAYSSSDLSLLPGTPIFTPPAKQGVQPMGFDLGGILGGISNIFGGNQNSVFSTISNVAGLAQQFVPAPSVPVAQPVAMRLPGSASVPAAAGAARIIGRGFFNKYPNLATAIQGYRNMGKNVTRSKLYSLMKRFGPDLLISGGILSAAAISELMVAGPGRRRMNPGNVKALRRSMRRLESFHHLCQRADKLRRPRARKTAVSRGGQQFVRQG